MSAYLLLFQAVVSCCLVTVLSTVELHAASTVYEFSIGASFDQFAYRNSVQRILILATPNTIPSTEFTVASVSSISINAGNVE